MAAGFTKGIVSGLAVSGAALLVASVYLPKIEMPRAVTPAVAVEYVEVPEERGVQAPAAPESESPEAVPELNEAKTPAPVSVAAKLESSAPAQPSPPETERRVIMEAPARKEARPLPGAAPSAPDPAETVPAIEGSVKRPEAPTQAPAMTAPEAAAAPEVRAAEASAPEQAPTPVQVAMPEVSRVPYKAPEPPVPAPKPVPKRVVQEEVTIQRGMGETVPGVTIRRGGPGEGVSAAAASSLSLQRFAAEAIITNGKPRMAIILIDDGTSSISAAALDSFPHPVTFAVPLSRTDAGEAMTAYRAQGKEVVALADLPEGAVASDVEVSLSAALDAAPESVAVMEQTPGALQSSREVSEQVAAVLQERGVGLILHPKGLNTGVAIAAKADVPAQAIFRDFDGKDQSATVIRRFLDQAAFKAGQEGDVLMLGRLRADTISALLLWALQDRASRVALVPVSQVLLDSSGPAAESGAVSGVEGETKPALEN